MFGKLRRFLKRAKMERKEPLPITEMNDNSIAMNTIRTWSASVLCSTDILPSLTGNPDSPQKVTTIEKMFVDLLVCFKNSRRFYLLRKIRKRKKDVLLLCQYKELTKTCFVRKKKSNFLHGGRLDFRRSLGSGLCSSRTAAGNRAYFTERSGATNDCFRGVYLEVFYRLIN